MGKCDGGRQTGAVTLSSIGCEEERLAHMKFQFVRVGDRLEWSKS